VLRSPGMAECHRMSLVHELEGRRNASVVRGAQPARSGTRSRDRARGAQGGPAGGHLSTERDEALRSEWPARLRLVPRACGCSGTEWMRRRRELTSTGSSAVDRDPIAGDQRCEPARHDRRVWPIGILPRTEHVPSDARHQCHGSRAPTTRVRSGVHHQENGRRARDLAVMSSFAILANARAETETAAPLAETRRPPSFVRPSTAPRYAQDEPDLATSSAACPRSSSTGCGTRRPPPACAASAGRRWGSRRRACSSPRGSACSPGARTSR
jgi:hypothetical protein